MKQLIKQLTPQFLLNWYRSYRDKQRIKGYKVLCPICNSQFEEFAPFGLVERKNAQCRNCKSLERHRLLWKYLQERTELFNSPKKIRLLHVAPERMFYNNFSENPNIEYYPCDLFPEFYNYDGKIKVTKTDITDIRFDENFFDVVLCSHVLEHVPNDALAMSELFRVLKKGGWAILQVPIDYSKATTYEDFSIVTPEGREKAFGQNDHVRIYGRDYKERLTKAGFRVNEEQYVKSFSSKDLFKYGLMESELVYYCLKD